MEAERWKKVNELFNTALERAADQRTAFLDEACAGDPDLRRQVADLLAADEQAGPFMETPAYDLADSLPPEAQAGSKVGQRIGPYQVLRQIGHGGMGVVYLAVRADDQYRKQVAIKLIRQGVASDAILHRFLNERQILAGLDHPNIAKLLDGGTTHDGLPYLVMDFVEGLPMDEYCDAHKLTITERIKLFLTVCSVVQYAHRNLVVHRDIKPGNILVTVDAEPKLLDFGIAKLLHSAPSAQTVDPTMPVRLMTPEYASPEQVRGEPITTGSDIYSLGVLLYKLLTGHLPYRFKSQQPQEIERVICEEEPGKPSTIIRRVVGMRRPEGEPEPISLARSSPPEKLRRRLSGDLDNIVLMALRKEPSRRYASVEQFAADLRRHLEGRPVEARQGGFRYRAAKFVRRNKVPVAATIVLIVSILGGIIGIVWQARKASLERARAERRFNDVRAVANSLIFELQEAIAKLPGSTAAQELLVKRALEYLDRLAREASGDPSLQLELATAYARLGFIQWNRYYDNLGDRAGALQSHRKAMSIRAAVLAANPSNASARRDLAFSYLEIGDALATTGDLRGALEHYRQSMRIREELVGARSPNASARRELAIAYQRIGDTLGNPGFANLGDRAGALEYYRKMQAIFEALVAEDRANTQDRHSLAIGYEKFGRILVAEGDLTGALALYRRELAIFQESAAASPTHVRFRRDVAVGYGNVGEALAQLGDYDGALENYRACLQIREELVAADPVNAGARRDLAFIQDVIANTLTAKGNYTEALELHRKALVIFEALHAADANNQAIRARLTRTLNRLAALLSKLGQKVPARSYAVRSLAIQKAQADRPKATAKDLHDYARALLICEPADLRDPQAARRYAQWAVEQAKENDPTFLATLALTYHLTGDPARAIEKAEKALALLPPNSAQRREVEGHLAEFKEAVRKTQTHRAAERDD